MGVESPERWSGVAHGGTFRAMVGQGGAAALSPEWSLTVEARATVFQASLVAEPEGPLVQPVVATAGVSWTPKRGLPAPNATDTASHGPPPAPRVR